MTNVDTLINQIENRTEQCDYCKKFFDRYDREHFLRQEGYEGFDGKSRKDGIARICIECFNNEKFYDDEDIGWIDYLKMLKWKEEGSI